ncbi:MAG: thioredoxin [Candidatus Calescibacterium sp.]|nr:thioredoxin [Candidatus Calescibacterium sp.]MCX7734755.1 thioredoxin [bacterium]MDW8088100.1 thioredoxin [Candidatus Calescibacterium sp.]
MKMAIHLDEKNFDKEINSDKPVLVDFWAEWCAPCRAIAPVLEDIDKELVDKIKVAKLNVDENPDIASRYKIFSIPTLVIFKNGKELGRMIGAAPKTKIIKFIDDSLKNS